MRCERIGVSEREKGGKRERKIWKEERERMRGRETERQRKREGKRERDIERARDREIAAVCVCVERQRYRDSGEEDSWKERNGSRKRGTGAVVSPGGE